MATHVDDTALNGKRKKTSSFLDQFKNISGCTFSQDIVDGLRKEIEDLKKENQVLKTDKKTLEDRIEEFETSWDTLVETASYQEKKINKLKRKLLKS